MMPILVIAAAFVIALWFSKKAIAAPFFSNMQENIPLFSSGGNEVAGNVLNFSSNKNDIISKAVNVANQFSIPPSLFLALIHQESGFNPKAQSPTGAYGLTQLEPETANAVGVGSSIFNSPDNQLYGGAKYLSQQYKNFGSWNLALAAYNAGPAAVQQYNGIPPYKETQNYVNSILAQQQNFSQYDSGENP